MSRFLIITFCFGLFAVPASAQGPAPAAINSPIYNELVGKVKRGDLSVDFKAMRFAFAEHGGTNVSDPRVHGVMLKALNEKKYKEAVKMAEGIHKINFVDMNSHIIAAMAYQSLGDAKQSKFHESVYLGLVNSIVKDGDGNSTKSAYVVISLSEVPVVLNALELKPAGQSIVEEDGHKYGILTATDKGTNETTKVYFNIDLASKGMEKVVKK